MSEMPPFREPAFTRSVTPEADWGIAAATATGDWDALIHALQRHVIALARHLDGPARIRSALEALPAQVREAHPELRHHHEFVGLQPVRSFKPQIAQNDLAKGGPESAAAIRSLAVALSARRSYGRLDLALELVTSVQDQVLAAADGRGSQAETVVSEFFSQAGKTYLLAGDPARALETLLLAWKWRHQDELGLVPAEVAGTIAALHASAGRLGPAEEWIEYARNWPQPDRPEHAEVLLFGVPLAEFVVACERLELERAGELLTTLPQPTQGFEFYPWVVDMRVRYFLLGGRPAQAHQQVIEAALMLDPDPAAALRADVLLALDDVDNAQELLRTLEVSAGQPHTCATVNPVRLRLLSARAAAQRGDFSAAIEHLSAADLNTAQLSAVGRDRLDSLALQAMSFLALGQRSKAQDTFLTLLDGVDSCVAVFATIQPRSARALFALCHAHPRAAEIEREWQSRKCGPVFPFEATPFRMSDISLTEREAVVLRYLAIGVSRKDIAQRESVSVNTVKTQIRSLFQKLGATNAHEAKQRGIESGLL